MIMNPIINCKTPSSNPRGSLSRLSDNRLWILKLFRKPPEILKIVPNAGHDKYTGENQPMRVKERRFGTSFRISVFKKASRNIKNFLFYNTGKKM